MEHNPLSSELLQQLFDFPKTGQRYRELMRFSPSELTLLAALVRRRRQEDPTITMSEISGLLEISKPAATQLVLRLCMKGYVERFHDEKDRRVIRIRLAPQTSQLVEQHIETLLASADRVIAALGEEKSLQLITLQKELHDLMFRYLPCESSDSLFANSVQSKEATV